MAYLGNAPARSFISFERQVFTIVNSQTVYTLDHSVTNENDIRLVVNNVVQEPGSGKAYTASGTTLTLSAALTNGTDEMYCVFLGRATATNAPGAGSVGTSQLAADAVTNAKIADDAISDEQLDPTVITGQTAETSIATDDLILLSDTSASGALRKMTRANFVSGIGGTNTPRFLALKSNSADQTISDATGTQVTFDVEVFDSNNAFASNAFTVPSGEGGTYMVGAGCVIGAGTYSQLDHAILYLLKNGTITSNYGTAFQSNPIYNTNIQFTDIQVLSAGDILTLNGYANVNSGSGHLSGNSNSRRETYFYAYKLIT